MFGSQVSMSLSGYYYNRIYTEYTDQRLGGRIGFGYQFTPALSAGIAYRGTKINITNPIDPALPDLAAVVGRDLAMHQFRVVGGPRHARQRLPRHRRAFDRGVVRTSVGLVPVSAGADRLAEILHALRAARRLGPTRVQLFREAPAGRATTRRSTTGSTPAVFRRIRGFQFRGASPQEIGPTHRPEHRRSAATSKCSPRPNTCSPSPPTTWCAA